MSDESVDKDESDVVDSVVTFKSLVRMKLKNTIELHD